MSNFYLGELVCVIPDTQRDSKKRKEIEAREFRVCAVFDSGDIQIEDENAIYDLDAGLLLHWDQATPCQRLGLCEGDEVRVVDAAGDPDFKNDDILTLDKDDGSPCPFFFVDRSQRRSLLILNRYPPIIFERLFDDEPTIIGVDLASGLDVSVEYTITLSGDGPAYKVVDPATGEEVGEWVAGQEYEVRFNENGDLDEAIKEINSLCIPPPEPKKPAISFLPNDAQRKEVNELWERMHRTRFK